MTAADAGTVVEVADAAALAEEAARRIRAAAAEAIRARGSFALALAGGSTPRGAYQALAREPAGADWPRWQVFFGDERCVPPDHADSNERMARAAWLARVPIPAANVHRMRTELGPPSVVAADYEAELRRVLGPAPVLDLVLLGLGPDGHTASLFPGSPAARERERFVAPVLDAPKVPAERVTLTFPVLEAARAVLVLVSGADKAAALAEALAERAPGRQLVARGLRAGRGTLTWLVDRAARGG